MFFSEPEPSASSRLVGVDKDKLRLTAKGCVTADGWWISDIHRAREYLVRSTRTSTKSPSPFLHLLVVSIFPVSSREAGDMRHVGSPSFDTCKPEACAPHTPREVPWQYTEDYR